MSNGFSPKDIKLDSLVPVSGIVTATPISKDTGLNWGSVARLRIDIKASGVTSVGTITAALQDRAPNGTFTTLAGANASVVITAAGFFTITQLVERAADQPNIPIRKQIRVVLTTTNAGDAVTIDNVWLYQEL